MKCMELFVKKQCQYLESTAAIREGIESTAKWSIGCIRDIRLGNKGYVKLVNFHTSHSW